MQTLTAPQLNEILQKQRAFFSSHETKAYSFRREQLKKLKAIIKQNTDNIAEALKKDLNKSYEEAYLTETSIVLQEIDYHLKNLKLWMEDEEVQTPLHILPSQSFIRMEPLGTALIIAPWNYPFQLLINPLVGAISAGCTAVLKPSPYTPHIEKVMHDLITQVFDEKYVAIVHGGKEENELLLKERFDLIFFTGSPVLGKVVMRAAAEHLTPVILELGGKSPCIVDEKASVAIAAKRIAWSKTINAGQTCIAPDYVLVHESVKDDLLKNIQAYWEKTYGQDASKSAFYPKIVNEKAFDRLSNLLTSGKLTYGGKTNREERFISPTILENVTDNDPVMQEEIFGPILPIMTYKHINEAIQYVNTHEKPLALYFYGSNKTAKEVLLKTSSGGACINDGLMHIANHHLPFGGVGNSGMGNYHGKRSFTAFSHQRGIVKTPTWLDIPFKYPPFKFFSIIKRIL